MHCHQFLYGTFPVMLEAVSIEMPLVRAASMRQGAGCMAGWTPGSPHLLDAAGVIDGDDVQQRVLPAVPAAQEVATDAAEAVDGHLQLGTGHLLVASLQMQHKHGLATHRHAPQSI